MYVDDILISGSYTSHYYLIKNLNQSFTLKDLGQVNYFLGIQVSSLPNGGLHLSQRKYIIDLLRAKMQYAKGINTPITSGQRLTSYGSNPVKDVQLYRSIVGLCSIPLLLD